MNCTKFDLEFLRKEVLDMPTCALQTSFEKLQLLRPDLLVHALLGQVIT